MVHRKQIIEDIRKITFGIGIDTTNWTEEQKRVLEDKKRDLENASKLAQEIHTKNPHFIFELTQNAEDNEYSKDVEPKIKFIIDSDCLIIQNNEMGFEEENVRALCKIGKSTKTKTMGYIGEKGIGFQSVFMVANKVQIFSNGFQFGFNYNEAEPVTMIIPEWIDEIPYFIDPNQTNIVLYIKPEVKNEISNYIEEIHPSLLLFLKKLKSIEIEETEDKEKKKIRRFVKNEEDGIVEVVYAENKSYWKVVRKKLEVNPSINEERRKDVSETEIILAFPLNESRVSDASNEQYVFAFFPVRKYGFRFIIQADFLLPITREDIIKDNKWNEWLRDSIVEVFLEAVRELKNDDKLRYSFYDYLFLEEVKDDFFLPLVEQIYEKLEKEECILTEADRWRKPSEVLIGDKGIRELVPNEDLQEFFGKEYLSEKIKAKKSVLNKLGVRDFSIDDLIDCLEKTEWIKKQDGKWIVRLFSYLSKKKLSDEQLERIKNLSIIKLENGELTSINEGTVFFPLEKKVVYGFEDELRVIKKDIIEAISEQEKEERDKILVFLKRLGLKQADPYEVIENHILPVYESEDWKQKDSRTLIGYIRYIKDNIGKYERESDKRLNANKSSWETKEDPLKRLKESLLIRINKSNKNGEGEEWYHSTENIYLPKIYGNDNNLEELFGGINVSFVHSCYIEQDIKQIDSESFELKNKLKGKGKKWKKKHKKEVKKIKEQIKRLDEEKKKVIAEWKDFFERIGVNVFLKVEKDSDTENPSYYYVGQVTRKYIPPREKKNTLWRNENWVARVYEGYYIGDDWASYDFQKIIEKVEGYNDETRKKEICERLLRGFEQNWENYKKYLNCDYYYRYHGQSQPAWSKGETKSTFLLMLQNLRWILTTKGLHKPCEVFLDKLEIREVLGDTVPYLAVEIKNGDFIKAIGFNTEANVDGVLNYLNALIKQKSEDKEKFGKLYKFLDEHFEEDNIKIKEEFARNPLIFVPGTDEKYYSSKEVIWKDVSNVFGKNRIYLEKHYNKLKKFFVEKLGISEKPTPKDYADVLVTISEKGEISNEDKKIIVRIYEELNHNLNPDKVENPISQEDWWNNFTKESIFRTNKDEFWSNDGDIFIKDNNELYELFKDEEDIAFLWLPGGYHPDKIKFFIKFCGLRYLSESVEIKPLIEETTEYSKDEKLTNLIQCIVPYVLRYLYWEENKDYEILKEEGILQRIGLIEVYLTDNLRVKYSIKVNDLKLVEKEAERKCIYHDGKLFKKNDASNYDLAVEFSKVFGEIKGLDDFVMNMLNSLSNAENIMKAKKIEDLPEHEKEILKKIFESKSEETRRAEEQRREIKGDEDEEKKEVELEKDSFKESVKEGDRGVKETPLPISSETAPRPLSESAKEHKVTEIDEDVFDKTKGKEWIPEIPAEKAPLRTKEYIPTQEVRREIYEDEAAGKTFATKISKGEAQSTEFLSEKAKKDIGREGEKYALYCILKEKLECFDIKIEDDTTFDDILRRYSNIILETDQGFKLQKNRNIAVEIMWLNKKEESGKHYDIKIVENGEEFLIEVKSTKEHEKSWFPVSKEQWRLLKEKGDKFCIYRVYGAGTRDARVEKIQNPVKLWQEGKIDADPVRIKL